MNFKPPITSWVNYWKDFSFKLDMLYYSQNSTQKIQIGLNIAIPNFLYYSIIYT